MTTKPPRVTDSDRREALRILAAWYGGDGDLLDTSDNAEDLYENDFLRESEEWGTVISEQGEELVSKVIDEFYRTYQLGPKTYLLRALRICRWAHSHGGVNLQDGETKDLIEKDILTLDKTQSSGYLGTGDLFLTADAWEQVQKEIKRQNPGREVVVPAPEIVEF